MLNGNLTITSSNLTDNKADERGGAIYNPHKGTVIINNAIFINNNAGKRGGAIYNGNGQLTVSNSLFENNNAGNRGGAIYGNSEFDRWSEQDRYQQISYSNFTNNTADNEGGALYLVGYLNATGNIFTNNHAYTKETIYLMGYWNGIFENNTYISTDIRITGLTLNIKDNRTAFNATEDIILIYDIALYEHYNYKDIQTGLRGITLYVDGENRTTLYENITLKNLNPWPHTAYFTVLDYESEKIIFYVFNETEISTPEASYDYTEGTNTKIPLIINDKSDLTGTINVTVKDQDSYRPLSIYYNVGNGYKISLATLADALENMYSTLDSSYTINMTYFSKYGHPSSTEFTLNINDERSTNIIYNTINNTEGNLQINITVQEAATNTPIPGANIQITGDITKNTTRGIITDDTLTAGEYTITVRLPKAGKYTASQTTIKFNVEIDKDKKIAELEEELKTQIENLTGQINELQKNLEGNQTALENALNNITALEKDLNANKTALQEALNNITALEKELQDAQKQIQTLQEYLEPNQTTLDIIQKLQNDLESNQTALKEAQDQIQKLQNDLQNNQTALKEAQNQISVLNDQIEKLKNQQKVSPKVTKILASKKTFKSKVKVKKYTATLKAGSKAVPKVKVYIKIKSKKYNKTIKATTNAKGKAIFKIKKLTKKGKYKATITFKGNKNYKASKKTVQIIIK